MSNWRRVPGALVRRAAARFIPAPPVPSQLEMLWPERLLGYPPRLALAPGFRLRTYSAGDQAAYFALLERAGMGRCPLEYWFRYIVPGGFFVIEEEASTALVATCLASHQPAPRHPFGGNLGWLAADPAYAGRGLGASISAAVVARLIAGGYRRIYLTTDDFRLAALKVYLRMGWVPFLYTPDMSTRWQEVCRRLSWPFTPEQWPALVGAEDPAASNIQP